MSSPAEIGLVPGHDLGEVHSLPEFRAVTAHDAITQAERELLVDQAAAMIDGVYVHLLHKRAMYAVEPSQRLRLLRRRLAQMTDAQFHAELLRVFSELHDLHTIYILPRPYQGPSGPQTGPFAFLGVLLEQYWEGEEPHWMVSKVFAHLTGDPHLVPGAEVLHWNGSPIAVAVARAAEQTPGANAAARNARGLDSMTFRTPALSPPPGEDWVDLRYRVDGSTHEARIPWRVFDTAADLAPPTGPAPPTGGAGEGAVTGVEAPPSELIGLDLRTELLRGVKKRLFAPDAVDQERRAAAGEIPPVTEALVAAGELPEPQRPEVKVRTVTTAHGTFGHLRIFTFQLRKLHELIDEDIKEFINEIKEFLTLLPREGLILDVRGNPGGYVFAAESLLQFLTPRRVQPAPTQFINSRMTSELCTRVRTLNPWSDSINASIETGAQYSSAIPLYGKDSEEAVNSEGQVYHGPVVLVTDALCYSATDFLAAGFQDHEIGRVLGVDDNTGAGGANVWQQADFRAKWPEGPFKPLPGGAGLSVSLRRSLRVGKRWGGQVVEDLGVIPDPDARHRMTRRDHLENNPDLMEKAGELLAKGTPRMLEVKVTARDSVAATLELTTLALKSVDIYVNGRPAIVARVHDGANTITVPLGASSDVSVHLEGFDNGTLVAARTLPLH
jgi:C-terminal processing protease CtpA/Prc